MSLLKKCTKISILIVSFLALYSNMAMAESYVCDAQCSKDKIKNFWNDPTVKKAYCSQYPGFPCDVGCGHYTNECNRSFNGSRDLCLQKHKSGVLCKWVEPVCGGGLSAEGGKDPNCHKL